MRRQMELKPFNISLSIDTAGLLVSGTVRLRPFDYSIKAVSQ